MFAAVPAELAQLDALRGGLFVLGLRIVPVFTLGALKSDNFAWHIQLSAFSHQLSAIALTATSETLKADGS
jgi:hypothetical protein